MLFWYGIFVGRILQELTLADGLMYKTWALLSSGIFNCIDEPPWNISYCNEILSNFFCRFTGKYEQHPVHPVFCRKQPQIFTLQDWKTYYTCYYISFEVVIELSYVLIFFFIFSKWLLLFSVYSFSIEHIKCFRDR